METGGNSCPNKIHLPALLNLTNSHVTSRLFNPQYHNDVRWARSHAPTSSSPTGRYTGEIAATSFLLQNRRHHNSTQRTLTPRTPTLPQRTTLPPHHKHQSQMPGNHNTRRPWLIYPLRTAMHYKQHIQAVPADPTQNICSNTYGLLKSE